jgi:hypothetical protein
MPSPDRSCGHRSRGPFVSALVLEAPRPIGWCVHAHVTEDAADGRLRPGPAATNRQPAWRARPYPGPRPAFAAARVSSGVACA